MVKSHYLTLSSNSSTKTTAVGLDSIAFSNAEPPNANDPKKANPMINFSFQVPCVKTRTAALDFIKKLLAKNGFILKLKLIKWPSPRNARSSLKIYL